MATHNKADDGDECIGYADAPPPPLSKRGTSSTTASTTSTTSTLVEDAKPAEPTADAPSPTDTTKDKGPNSYHFWVLLVSVCYFLLPWTLGLIITWMPMTKIALAEAPASVLVSCIASTVEFATIMLFAITSCSSATAFDFLKSKGSTAESSSPILMRLYLAWEVARNLSPVVTGAYTWHQANQMHCRRGDESPACRVGQAMIAGIDRHYHMGNYRKTKNTKNTKTEPV